MQNQFLVVKPFQYMVECTCPRPDHTFFLDLHKGDIITVTEEKKYVDSLGWLMLVMINDYSVYMFVQELEDFIDEEKIVSVLDMELKRNYLQFKVNESLDILDKEGFEQYAKELAKVKEMVEIGALS
ncbi:hypothetical protein [Niallia taxi]|uniref:IDEAL domain-containing protein n=1 Tax=Niallia taxi TaxID=2499688 RepID=A0A437K3V9_9BACI|nr:hypothetical protein [Niallia taxi]MDE5053241.1 hypothetical protein [Niallia taxi]MDK8640950.1 hypothetical protein [Niallia taxi]MED3963436.1 hypothetical protein [Niallia taxi]RVT57133.1 hypothetical protein EM808_25395 [Niallia taxi]WOD61376.1 hypothetical protein NQZ71_11120 [Niallia taxi]